MEGVNHPASRDRSAVFAVFFFLTTSLHSGVSVGKNVGGTVKSTPNGKNGFLKWFAASLAVSLCSLSSSLSG